MVAKFPKNVYDGRVRKVFLGIFLFFIITILFSNSPLSAQSPSCSIVISPNTGISHITTFKVDVKLLNFLPDPRLSIDIINEAQNTPIGSVLPSIPNNKAFSVEKFGPLNNPGNYYLRVMESRVGGNAALCKSDIIRIEQGPTPTPPIPTPTPIPPLPPCAEWGVWNGSTYVPVGDKIKDYQNDDGSFRAGNNVNCIKFKTAIGEINPGPTTLVTRIFSLVLGIAGGIALILIILSGYKMMASQGNPEALVAARDQLLSAVIGLLFIIFSFVILQVIGVDVLKIPGFG